MILAERIRKIREAKKMTQDEVAAKCNISTSAYGQIERKASNSSISTLAKITSALEVSLPFLIDTSSKEYFEKYKL